MDVEQVEAQAETNDEATEGLEDLDADAVFQQKFGATEDEDTEESDDSAEAGGEDSGGIEIAGIKYAVGEIEELIAAGKDAKEIKAESTRRFQEAADMRKDLGDYLKLKEAWEGGDGAVRRQIVQELSKMVGDDQDVPQVADVPWDDMTDTEKFLYRNNLELKKEIGRLRGELSPTLREVSDFVGQTKAEKQAIADAAAIKQKFGVDVSPETVSKMRANGISDPAAAFEFFKPMIEGSFAKGHEQGSKPKPVAPTDDRKRTFDPTDVTADEAMALYMKGYRPAS